MRVCVCVCVCVCVTERDIDREKRESDCPRECVSKKECIHICIHKVKRMNEGDNSRENVKE